MACSLSSRFYEFLHFFDPERAEKPQLSNGYPLNRHNNSAAEPWIFRQGEQKILGL